MDLSRESPAYLLAAQLGEALRRRGWNVTTAESCTGGGVSFALTSVPGSSGWLEGAYVTYSNRIKTALLGVEERVLETDGAVSEATVRQMAAGALRLSGADLAVSISGIAGPDGGTASKPVGTVWFAWMRAGEEAVVARHVYKGNRDAVREQAIMTALQGLLGLAG
ncbi:CinA family protein [Gilvimarinus sp. F26214L]|uniref:CinA family protein n=1 Tax=Gilvimarinus sp. DZF01 TaxID=3461371 RepID=UPI0040467098